MDKYLKAFNKLKLTIWKLSNNEPKKKDCESLIIIHELIMKEVPIKPDLEGDGYDGEGNIIYDTSICPICHRTFEIDYDEHVRYCPNCGQKLDWRGEENE